MGSSPTSVTTFTDARFCEIEYQISPINTDFQTQAHCQKKDGNGRVIRRKCVCTLGRERERARESKRERALPADSYKKKSQG